MVNIRFSCPSGVGAVVGSHPTTPTAASIIGGMQVQEAVKLIHGLPVYSGRGAYYSGSTLRMTLVDYPCREDCPAHETYEDIVELPHGADDLKVSTFLSLADGNIMAVGREVLTYFACPACGHHQKVYRPCHLVADKINCPICGKQRLFDLTYNIGSSEDTADVCLSQLGVPKLHIVPVLTKKNGWRYYELTGDAASMRL